MFERATPPPKYIVYTPVLLNAWYEWYELLPHEQVLTDSSIIKPMGEIIAPAWARHDFKGLEDFYLHYTDITREVD